MKPICAYVVAFFRVVAVGIGAYGLFATYGTSLALHAFGGRDVSPPEMSVLFRLCLLYLLTAAIVWSLSRPIARIVTYDL